MNDQEWVDMEISRCHWSDEEKEVDIDRLERNRIATVKRDLCKGLDKEGRKKVLMSYKEARERSLSAARASCNIDMRGTV